MEDSLVSLKDKLKEALNMVDLLPEKFEGLNDKELEDILVFTARLEEKALNTNRKCYEYATSRQSMPALKRELQTLEAEADPDPAALRSIHKAIKALLQAEFVPVLQAAKKKRDQLSRDVRDAEHRASTAQSEIKHLDAKLTDAIVKRVKDSGLPSQEIVRIFVKVMDPYPRNAMDKVIERAKAILPPEPDGVNPECPKSYAFRN
jgi:hypothetical protein